MAYRGAGGTEGGQRSFLLSTNGIKATGFQPVRFSVMYYNLPSHFEDPAKR